MDFRSLSAALAAALLLPTLAAADPATDAAITRAALGYAEAWATGDATRMESVLHPEFLRRRIVVDPATGEQWLSEADAQGMVQTTARNGQSSVDGPLDLRVTILDQVDGMASVRVVFPLYVDYLHMVNWQGRWVVLSVLWGPLGD